MMEAARTSETSVDIQLRTRLYIPEGSELQKRKLFILKLRTALMMEAARTSETSVDIHLRTRLYIPEGSV
jgi:hypothetical protein